VEVLLAICTLITLAAIGYLVVALWSVARLPLRRSKPGDLPALTVLKPLCGDEPSLDACLRSFCVQDYPAPLQIVFGLRDPADPAYALARRLQREFPERDIDIVVDASVHGPNLKASNLVNMARAARHDVFVVSDSDVLVAPDCLKVVAAGLHDPDIGAVTCLFRGLPRPGGNWVSQLGSLFLDAWFLPSAIVDATLSSVSVCYGPVTAIRREVIEHEGGFAQLTHVLADDTELGHITTRAGKRIALAPIAVDTLVSETRLSALFAHELRWARTTRALRPSSFVASFLTHALPVAILAFALRPLLINGLLMGAVAALRAVLLAVVEVRFGRASTAVNPTPWMLAFREILYCGVWAMAFVDRRITWRGRKLKILPGARLAVDDDAETMPIPDAERSS
jgi:ceramide glucosyltransferase